MAEKHIQAQKDYVKIQGACRKIRGVSEHYEIIDTAA